MKHVMIDLETLGISADSVFLSIAAVQFDLRGNTDQEFLMNVELESALKAGRTISPGTLQWWLTQRPEIMNKMFNNPTPLEYALEELGRFLLVNHIVSPWGNSANFDLGMLANAYTKACIPLPWRYSNERCYRTAFALSGLKHNVKPENAHDLLEDCRYQIKELARLELWKLV